MSIDISTFVEILKKLLLMIFEKFEVDKEFEAIGVDIVGILGGGEDTPTE